MEDLVSSRPSGGARVSWLLVIVYAGVLVALSSVPADDLWVPDVLSWDKLIHAIAFGVLAALVTWALLAGRLGSRTALVLIISTALVTGFGVTDELHQSLTPGRDSSVLDVLADAVGAATASPLAALFYRWRHPMEQ